MRRFVLAFALLSTTALAQPAPAPAADPVVARVDGAEIRLSDVQEAMVALPAQYRNAPPQVLFPLLVDQLTAQQAILAAAKASDIAADPDVARRIRHAQEQELQQAYITREIAPAVTDEALRARFDAQTAGRPAEEEVHARHILVPTEAEARSILEEVSRPGVDFAEVARRRGSGPGTAEGGDLGFFKRGDMVAEFATAAFALQPGQIAPEPVRSQFGWHVIKVEERRPAPAPSFDESKEALRQQAFEEAVGAVIERVRSAAKIERFNMDGTPVAAPTPTRLPDASPPPPAAAPTRR